MLWAQRQALPARRSGRFFRSMSGCEPNLGSGLRIGTLVRSIEEELLNGGRVGVQANRLSDLKMSLPAASTLSKIACQDLHVSCSRLRATCVTHGHQCTCGSKMSEVRRFIPHFLICIDIEEEEPPPSHEIEKTPRSPRLGGFGRARKIARKKSTFRVTPAASW